MHYYGITMKDELLMHHGVKGQRWGIKRYLQNRKTNRRRKEALKNAREIRRQKIDAENKKKELKAKVLASGSAKQVYKNRDLFTAQELNDFANRVSIEQRLSQLSDREVSKGKQYINKMMNGARTINDMANTGITMYTNYQMIRKIFTQQKKSKSTKDVDK